jgi:hypothetical protein
MTTGETLPGGGSRRVWTHLFVEFSLTADERRELDRRLSENGTTLPQVVVSALASYVPLDPDAVTEAFGTSADGDDDEYTA